MLSAEAPNLSWRSRVTSAVAVAPFPSGVSAETGRHVSEPSDPDTAYHADPTETLSQRRADALARFAETYLSHGLQAMTGGERHQVVVHVDAETLAQRTPGRCTLEGGPALGAETARRLSCDASISPALSRALRTRDGGCRFPGCGHKRFVDGHHIRHWADGGHTRLSNLVPAVDRRRQQGPGRRRSGQGEGRTQHAHCDHASPRIQDIQALDALSAEH